MNWRCLFGHDWKYVYHRGIDYFVDIIFCESCTKILYKCKRCQKLKVKEIKGDFHHLSAKDFE